MSNGLQDAKEALDKAIKETVEDHKFKQEREHLVERVSKDLVSSFKPFLEGIRDRIKEAISEIRVAAPVIPPIHIDKVITPPIVIPEIKIPDIHVQVPEIKVPTIIIPKLEIPEIRIPEIKVPVPQVNYTPPAIHIPEIKMPDEMNVKGWVQLMGVSVDSPLPVQLRDKDGKPVNLVENLTQFITGTGGARIVKVSEIFSTVPVTQVSGANFSVNVTNTDLDIRDLTNVTDSISAYQVSGANFSVEVATQPITFDVKQVSGANWSVSSVPLGNSFVNITGATSSTVVKVGAGILHTVVINTRGTGSNCKVYADLVGEGSLIATIDTTLSTTDFLYDIAFTSGLTVVTAGASAADLTISYY